jgi:TonB family protein
MGARRTAILLSCLVPAAGAVAATLALPSGPVIQEGVLKGCQLMSSEQIYPRAQRMQKIAGQVLVELEIRRNGMASGVQILSSTPEGAFDAAAKDWFSNLRCSNAKFVAPAGRFKFLLVYNLPDNLGDPIDATIDSWVITGR